MRKTLRSIILAMFLLCSFTNVSFADWFTYHSSEAAFPNENGNNVAVYIPRQFNPSLSIINLIFYFHGFNDCLEKIMNRSEYNLGTSMDSIADTHTILVVPEGPRNKRGAYWGKLHRKNQVKKLVEDVLDYLKKSEHISRRADLGKVVISAHSGGFMVAAAAIERGGLEDHLDSVLLFDALYGCEEIFLNFAKAKPLYVGYTTRATGRRVKALEKTSQKGGPYNLKTEETKVGHNESVGVFFPQWFKEITERWKKSTGS